MKNYIRLVFRIVVSESSQIEQQDILFSIKEKIEPFGVFYDMNISPYPKIPDSSMARIEFDIPLPVRERIQKFVAVIGGYGWHISDVGPGDEQDAIWVLNEGIFCPLNRNISWIQIQLIPYRSLAESRKQ